MAEWTIDYYEVPIDDQWHDFLLTGSILHVAARHSLDVEFWAMHHDGAHTATHRLRVFATAQPHVVDELGRLPTYHGTAIDADGRVWHLMEAAPPRQGQAG